LAIEDHKKEAEEAKDAKDAEDKTSSRLTDSRRQNLTAEAQRAQRKPRLKKRSEATNESLL